MLKGVRDTIIVKTEYEEQSKGGIIIPDGAKQYHGSFWGRVVAVGPEYPYDLKSGDKAYFRRHEGFYIHTNEGKFLSLREKWVVGKEVA